ncbi:alpha/beta hydrolase [Dulcicalothrix desertica]|uniref:alpha/beta hydrolase n=1 Tax=Dulcicalothrix desertica TaxID=32056 RepID=UPI0011997F48|nr:alpha/beta hydrolase [Dulcicalothrix desertica]TWH43131.1 putative dienelactone hydrolase [Dulcicalothrix desertica PCC 7102]
MGSILRQKKVSFLNSLLCSLGVVCGWGIVAPTAQAAESITIQLGPFEQKIQVDDLEDFAKNGKLPKELQVFSSFLTPQVKEVLNQRLQLNPEFADNFIDGLAKTPQGQRLISSLGGIIPGSTAQSLKDTLNLTARRFNGLTVLGFVRSYPGENITVDATKAIGLSLELNANNLQSQAFAALLERELPKNDIISLPRNINPGRRGNEQVQLTSFTFQDRQRNRTIPVDIYSTTGTTQQPLVVISHGFGANRRHLQYLAQHLASYGFTVAALEHPGSNAVAVNRVTNSSSDLSKLISAKEFIDRPQDVSFLLNEFSKLNLQPGQLQNKLNTDNVTVVGHSLGGYTALALAGGKLDLDSLRKFCKNSLLFGEAPGDWLQCAAVELKDSDIRTLLQDKRIKGAIVLNPLVGNLFGRKGLENINTPVLMLASSDDALTPALKHQFAPFTELRGNKYLITAIGGTHLSVSDPTYQTADITNIVKERRGAETNNLRQLVSGVSLAFIKQQTDEAKTYQPFLTPAYAKSLSTTQLPLRLVSELPGNLKKWAEFAAN